MKQLTLILIIILLTYTACTSKSTESATETDAAAQNPMAAANDNTSVSLTTAQLKNADLKIGLPKRKNISRLINVNGTIDVPPQNLVSISFPMGGYIKQTKLLPGMHVKKGETLAVLEDPQYLQLQQDYLTAKARINFLQLDYARQKELNQSKATSDKSLQTVQNELQTQNILLKTTAQKLKMIGIDPNNLDEDNLHISVNIPSPIDGYVTDVRVNIGQYVSPTEILFELVNPQDIHLALKVFEKDLFDVKIGQKVLAYTNNNPNKKYPAEIILINKEIDEDRSVEVHCHFEKYDHNLVVNQFMVADIDAEASQVLAVPSEAIMRYENRQFIYAADGNNTFKIIEVVPGNSEGDMTAISSLDPDIDISKQQIVLKNAYTLLMKMKNTAEEE